jgi:hypothetical protein
MSDAPIYGRIEAAIKSVAKPTHLFLGTSEWDELVALCRKWGHDWPSGGVRADCCYDPAVKRARFLGVPIYRVDAETMIEVLQ